MADKIDPLDIGALERSLNDSATRVSAIWLSFVAFSAYLAAAASNVSHRQIFLEEPIKLPTINIDLPLVASAILLPLLFVIYHVYVLLQVVLLARTADAYNEALDHGVAEGADRTRVRQRLANTLFAQMFAGSPREREGLLGWLLRLMAWITLAIAPVLVLLLFQIKFLPYHSGLVTWTHRALVVIDLAVIMLLWAGAVDARRDLNWRSLVRGWKTAPGAIIVLLSWVLVTFPGEPGRLWMAYVGPSDQTANDIAECQVARVVGAVVAPAFDRLVLLGEDFVDDEKLGRIRQTAKTNGQAPYESERTRIFRGRDLRCGRFAGSDLRHADFAESNLSGAILRGAHLEGATFSGALLAGAILDSAQLQDSSFAGREIADRDIAEAQLPNAFLRGTQLDRANLKGANLRGSDLRGAQLQGANLELANLRGASLRNTVLREASLGGAQLQGASFQAARMRKASLDSAEMQGANLTGAWLNGASLNGAKLHGALFYGTQLLAATLRRTQLQGALFRNARFDGTAFIEAQLQGAQFEGAGLLRYVVVSDSYLWRAGRIRCDNTQVAEPNFDPIIEVSYSRNQPVPVQASAEQIADFIARSLKDVPPGSKAVPEFSKANLERDLNARLRASAEGATAGEQTWKICARESQARTPADFQELTARMVRLACAPGGDRNDIVKAVLEGWTTEKLVDAPVAKAFAQAVLENGDKCPGAGSLNDETKARLKYVVDPGE